MLIRAHDVHGLEWGHAGGARPAERRRVWLTVHTIFTLRYALLYYADPQSGIEFNAPDRPAYRDFAYLALTIGMTFQVSDTNLQTTDLRSTALRHALLSYLLGSIILAAAVNLVAGLG